jgi:hypothetical protein
MGRDDHGRIQQDSRDTSSLLTVDDSAANDWTWILGSVNVSFWSWSPTIL